MNLVEVRTIGMSRGFVLTLTKGLGQGKARHWLLRQSQPPHELNHEPALVGLLDKTDHVPAWVIDQAVQLVEGSKP